MIMAESIRYGEWQELVLATLKMSQDRLNQLLMGSGKQVPILAT